MSVDMSVPFVKGDTPGAKIRTSDCRRLSHLWNSLFIESEVVRQKCGELLSDKNPINRCFLSSTIVRTDQEPKPNQPFFMTIRRLVPMVASSFQLLTIPQAASILAVSPSTLRRLLAHGDIEYTRIQRAVRIRREALEAYVDRNTTYVSIRHGSNS